MTPDLLSIAEVVALTGATSRTLRHYGAIGLLPPSAVDDSGMRYYDRPALTRLQQILVLRELDVPLADIRAILDRRVPAERALAEHRDALIAAAERLLTIADAVQATITNPRLELQAMFNGFTNDAHADEARARWGGTDAYRESARRTKSYGAADWDRFQHENTQLMQTAVELMAQGVAPDAPAAMAIAEQARLQIDRWFYPCPPHMHRTLGEMYLADERFTATYEAMAPGMAAWWSAAVCANADTQPSS